MFIHDYGIFVQAYLTLKYLEAQNMIDLLFKP